MVLSATELSKQFVQEEIAAGRGGVDPNAVGETHSGNFNVPKRRDGAPSRDAGGVTYFDADDAGTDWGHSVGDASDARLNASGLIKGGLNYSAKTSIAVVRYSAANDIRARLQLSPGAGPILYRAPDNFLQSPLRGTDGVVWPYTPTINVSYSAAYTAQTLAHTNYAQQSYNMSTIDQITVTGIFTANTPAEAQYMLAMISFLRSATKMFFGEDTNRGTPPPVMRFSAHGPHMFNSVPVVVTNHTQDFEGTVDYIDAPSIGSSGKYSNISRVPSQMTVYVTLMPVISRTAQTRFSLAKYARGELIGGRTTPGGMP
jgi:hypothetical protein